MNLVLTLALTAVCLGGETFFHAPRAYLGERAFSLRLSDERVANGHTLLVEYIPDGPGEEACRDLAEEAGRDLAEEACRAADLTVSTSARIHRLYPHPTASDGVLFALIGIPYRAAPGPDIVHVEWTESDRAFGRELPFTIVPGPYRSEQIRGVPQSRVTPSVTDFRRIAREQKIIAAAYEAVRDTVMMEDTFRYPVEKKTITSPYGTRRVFNGQLRSYHGGLDLRAYEGTPLYAAQSGVVKLAQNLFYSGNHVLIEHGMGIHTGYSHMSRLNVKTGDEVSRGQLLGLSGATGRVTAAHLHWTVSVDGVGVSPLQFTEILAMLYQKPVEVRKPNDG